MISGKILRDAIISGANNINNQRSRVDELNVFPVPDGDTGTNMGMTVGASVAELNALDDGCTVGEAAKTAASAMLRGARGNSGVITSLLFRPQQCKAVHRERRQGRVHRRPDEGGGHQERLLHPVPHQQVRGRKRRKDARLC